MSTYGDGIATDDHQLIGLFGKLHLTLGSIDKRLEQRERSDRQARQATSPSMVRIHGTGIIPASGFLVVPFDKNYPNQGYYWNVHRISISGTSPVAALAGRADVFVSAQSFGQVTNFNQIGMADWADQATALPLVGSYGAGELQLRSQEKLHIIISGGTAGQIVIVNCLVEQVQESATVQTSSV